MVPLINQVNYITWAYVQAKRFGGASASMQVGPLRKGRFREGFSQG